MSYRNYIAQKEKKTPSADTSAGTAKTIGESLGIEWESTEFTPEDLAEGLSEELSEHGDVIGRDATKAAKIALAHLKKTPRYYKLVAEYVEGK